MGGVQDGDLGYFALMPCIPGKCSLQLDKGHTLWEPHIFHLSALCLLLLVIGIVSGEPNRVSISFRGLFTAAPLNQVPRNKTSLIPVVSVSSPSTMAKKTPDKQSNGFPQG